MSTLQQLAETYMAESYGAGDSIARLEEFVAWSEGQVTENEEAYLALKRAARDAKPKCLPCNGTGETNDNGRPIPCMDCFGEKPRTIDVQWDRNIMAPEVSERKPSDCEHSTWLALETVSEPFFTVTGSTEPRGDLVRRYRRIHDDRLNVTYHVHGAFDTREEAQSRIHDVRRICSSCRPGRGRYRCQVCQSAILTAGLAASVVMHAEKVA